MPATPPWRSSRARRSLTSGAGRRGWAGRSPGTRSRTTSTPTSAWTSGTAPTRSSATATRSSAPTSSTTAATRPWGAPGATSTSPRWGARRSGRTRRRATHRLRPTSGGTCTTGTATPDDRPRGRRAAGGGPLLGDRRRRRIAGGARLDNAARATRTVARGMIDSTTLRMERTFQAPAQAVFDAWTSEEVIRRWWHAEHDWETTVADVDLRVGGAVRVVMRNPHEDVEYGGGGRYTEIDPPKRLAFTWIWDDNPTRTLIEIEFEERDGATTVRF